MSSPSRHPLPLSFPFTLLLLLTTAGAGAVPSPPTPLVQDICNQTSSFSLCVEALYADPETSTTTNKTTMIAIAVRLVGKNSGATYVYISELMNRPPPAVGRVGRQRLHICEMCYLSVSYDMLLLSSAVNGALASQAMEVAAEARRCDAAFSKSTWQPMGNRNKVLVVLCQAIVALSHSFAGPGEITH